MLGSNPGQLRLRHWLSLALTTRLNLIHFSDKSHPLKIFLSFIAQLKIQKNLTAANVGAPRGLRISEEILLKLWNKVWKFFPEDHYCWNVTREGKWQSGGGCTQSMVTKLKGFGNGFMSSLDNPMLHILNCAAYKFLRGRATLYLRFSNKDFQLFQIPRNAIYKSYIARRVNVEDLT